MKWCQNCLLTLFWQCLTVLLAVMDSPAKSTRILGRTLSVLTSNYKCLSTIHKVSSSSPQVCSLVVNGISTLSVLPTLVELWEAAVGFTMRLLVRTMNVQVFSYEELTTILICIEAVLNFQPLTPVSTNPHHLKSLIPGDFLIRQPLIAIPPRSNPDIARNLTNRWKLLDQCHQAFWKRWSMEYLTTLQECVNRDGSCS